MWSATHTHLKTKHIELDHDLNDRKMRDARARNERLSLTHYFYIFRVNKQTEEHTPYGISMQFFFSVILLNRHKVISEQKNHQGFGFSSLFQQKQFLYAN